MSTSLTYVKVYKETDTGILGERTEWMKSF